MARPIVSADQGRVATTARPVHRASMRTLPTIVTTIEHDGAYWTVLADGNRRATPTALHFVRDWIVGGTRRIVRPLTEELMVALTTEPLRRRDALLHRELEDGLSRQAPAKGFRPRKAGEAASHPRDTRRASEDRE